MLGAKQRDSNPPGIVARLRLARFFCSGLKVVASDRKRLALLLALASLAGLLEVGFLAILASLMVHIANVRALPPQLAGLGLMGLLGISGLMVLGLAVINFPLSWLFASLCARAIERLRLRLLRAYLASTLVYRDGHREGLWMQLAGEYVNRAEILVQYMFLASTQAIILAIFLVIAVAFAPMVTILILAGLALCLLLAAPLLSRMRHSRRDYTVLQRELLPNIGQTGRLSEEIASFGVRSAVVVAMTGLVRDGAAQLERMRYEARLFPVLVFCMGLAMVLGLIMVVLLMAHQDFSGLLPLTILLFRAAAYLRGTTVTVQNGLEFVDTTEMLLAEIAQLEAHAEPQGGTASLAEFPGLVFREVSYAYAGGKPVLDKVSFTLMPGEMLGIVGRSGSGKSTLGNLIIRVRKPSDGQILAGELSLDAVAPDAWARLSGFVGQDSKLIHGSVADNIRFFRSGFTLKQVQAAARAAHIDADIAAMPQGFNTLIGPGARGLSGGQRQRLAIARALLASPRLLVLDEPTSALDETSEMLISQTLRELKGKTTIVLIAHRPATLEICDRVLRLVHGRLVPADTTAPAK
jgi:ABC-type multidrug transport system fused ATPase/permease subunit